VRDVEAFSSLDEIEPHWLALEAEARASPFQRFAFAASYVRNLSPLSGAEPSFVLIRDDGGKATVILPLEKVRRSGITILRSLGGKHASFHLALASREGEVIIAADPVGMLRRAASAAGGADLVMLTNQPLQWEGRSNPLALHGAVEAASHAYGTALATDDKAFIEAHSSSDSRKKLRKKRQALTKLGKVVSERARDPSGIENTLAAFFAQKARRFASQGIANPFADAATQAFLRAACAPSGTELPAIELYALRCADNVVAVFGLAVGFSRASGMFTSFDDDPAIARCSPGDILLNDMVSDLISRGLKYFDLGVGEARYKNSFCRDEVRLVDAYLPLTLYGRLASAAMQTASRVKAAVKRDRRLLNAANRLRSAARRLG
jgi:CelD/BcsL family acetyltransferase involved in cellulose biosynthesis